MFNRALTLVLLGVLFMGIATLTFGTVFDEGFSASAAGLMGLGEDGGDGDGDGDGDDD